MIIINSIVSLQKQGQYLSLQHGAFSSLLKWLCVCLKIHNQERNSRQKGPVLHHILSIEYLLELYLLIAKHHIKRGMVIHQHYNISVFLDVLPIYIYLRKDAESVIQRHRSVSLLVMLKLLLRFGISRTQSIDVLLNQPVEEPGCGL